MLSKKKSTRKLDKDEYLSELGEAISAITTAIYSIEHELNSLNTQMDMVAVLSNGISEILLDKKLVTEEEMKEVLAGLKTKLDEEREKSFNRAKERALEKYNNDLLKNDYHGNA